MQGHAERRGESARPVMGAVWLLAAALTVGLAGCSGTASEMPGTSAAAARTTGLRDIPPPAVTTPEGVAVAALREIYTWRPAQEQPGDSFRRARQWLGPNLIRVADGAGPAAAATTPAGTGNTTTAGAGPAEPPPAATTSAVAPATPPPSLRWSEWAAAGATVEAFAFASGEVPADTDPNRVLRKIGIEQTVVYRDRREQLPSSAVVATLVKTDAGWRLDSYL